MMVSAMAQDLEEEEGVEASPRELVKGGGGKVEASKT
jgi:hypothetical protein